MNRPVPESVLRTCADNSGGCEPEPARERLQQECRLGYRPGLDGLRGISILAVLATHTQWAPGRAAFIGVDIFFVLSGFLITCLLMQEWDRFRSIGLGKFYLRRILRLLPALLVMLVVVTAYHWVVSPRPAARAAALDALIALFYASNWAHAAGFHMPNLFGHTWSLSIEEQFYLLWPLVLIWLLRRTSNRKSMLNWVLLMAFLPMAERLLLVMTDVGYNRIMFGTDTRADPLLLGCAAGVAFNSGLLPQSRRLREVIKWLAWLALLGLVWLSFYLPWYYEVDLCLIYFVIPALASVVLVHVILSQTGVLNRVLSQPWLVYLGRISYGLYLWHYPIFVQTQSRRWAPPKELAVELSVSAAVTLASYYLLERPILRWKESFAGTGKPVHSSGLTPR